MNLSSTAFVKKTQTGIVGYCMLRHSFRCKTGRVAFGYVVSKYIVVLASCAIHVLTSNLIANALLM